METLKVFDKSDSFDVQVELSRKFIDENFGKRPIKLEKDGYTYELVQDEFGSTYVVNEGYYQSPEDVLLEFGIISQYQ